MGYMDTKTLRSKKNTSVLFRPNVDTIEKTHESRFDIFSSNFDHHKYVKFRRQMCLPTLLHGSKIFKLITRLLK